MKSSRSQGTFVAFLTLAFLLGIGSASAVYWLLVAPGSTDQLADSVSPSPPSQLDEPITYQDIESSEIAVQNEAAVKTIRRIDDLNDIKSSFERGLALRSLLSNSTESQVAEFFKQTLDLPPTNTAYGRQVAVIQRFAHLNPRRALSVVLELDTQQYSTWQFISSIFREWAHSNLDEAVAHARSLDENWKRAALEVIVQERRDLSEEILIAIARDLGNEQIAISAIAQQKIEEAIGDPEKAWNEIVVELQDDTEHSWSIARVAAAWVEQSGLSVLDQIAQSLTNVGMRQTAVSTALRTAAITDPAGAFRYALTLENDQYNQSITGVLDTWARSDPHAALAAVSEVERRTLRRELEESVVRTWAYDQPRAVLESLSSLPEHAQPTAISTALQEIASNSPEEAAQFVATVESGPTRMAAATSVAFAWINEDHEAALDWILNDPATEEIASQLLQQVLWSLVRIDPTLAMATALAQPISADDNRTGWGSGMGLELAVISTLVHSDLDTAIELLPQVREGATRQSAYQAVTSAMIRDGQIDEALGMVRQVPESDRTALYMALASAWAGSDPEGLLNSMDRLPSKEVKSRAAMTLVSHNRFQKSLTEEQLEKAKKFLTDEDAKALEEGDENVFYGW